ncbi:MAG: L-lactate dehydrogenase [Clostridia bacterium]|nr:L-lactate dehydrogenase [Clostridia bacterium]
MINPRKGAVIGCGFVGAASAYTLMQSRLFSEMVLIDVNNDKAVGEAMDISAGVPFAGPMNIYAGSYDDVSDAGLVVVTAGANQKPGQTRLDLVKTNVGIFRSIIPAITKSGFEGILLIVSNPVDILTYAAVKLSGLPENHVFGSGTVLDTARLKYRVGQYLGVNAQCVHAFIIGEHGDSEFPAWSCANISDVPIAEFCDMRGFHDHPKDAEEVAEDVRNSAYEIIKRKGATYYGIAMSVTELAGCILRDERSVFSVSSMMHGQHGIDGISLSMPAIVGKNGIETLVPMDLDEAESKKLQESAQVLKETAASLDL